MAGNVLIKNANGNTVTLQNPDTNLADVVVDTSNIASTESPAFTGSPTAPTPTAGDNSTKLATTQYVDGRVSYDTNTSRYITNTLLSSSIIERGSNNNGEYVKYADGTLICTYTATVTNQAIATAYGSLFLGTRAWTFPHAFSSLPVCRGDAKWGNAAPWSSQSGVLITAAVFYFIDNLSRASGTSTDLTFSAIGRWK